MPEIDYIIRGLKFSKKGIVIDIDEFYKVMKKFLKDKRYTTIEKDYEEKSEGESLQSFKFKWENHKDADDYHRFNLDFTLKFKNFKEVEIKKKEYLQGDLDVEIEANIASDYEELIEKKHLLKFLRGAYDKFIISSKREKYSKELLEEAYEVLGEVKKYLKTKV